MILYCAIGNHPFKKIKSSTSEAILTKLKTLNYKKIIVILALVGGTRGHLLMRQILNLMMILAIVRYLLPKQILMEKLLERLYTQFTILILKLSVMKLQLE